MIKEIIRRDQALGLLRIFPLLLVLALAGCASGLPRMTHETGLEGAPVADSFVLEQRQKHLEPDSPYTAFSLLNTGRDAFLVRAALIETASHTIDAQYYIWNDDPTGRYLAGRLIAAADRGVKVRVLLDDMNAAGDDALFATMDSHPNIEVRIFNPVRARSGVGRWFSLLANFDRVNRRMHNKSFVVDGAAGITGGRNIGDEYFDEDPAVNARDRDVLMLGSLIGPLSDSFLAYWNNGRTYPVRRLYEPEVALDAEARARLVAQSTGQLSFHAQPVRGQQAAQAFLEGRFEALIPAQAELVFDPPPADFEAPANTPQPSAQALYRLAASAESEILIESAYLILTDDQLDRTHGFGNDELSVVAFTNSLVTNDLVTNHSGYARWRGEMLRQGMELYELRPDAQGCRNWIVENGACGGQGLTLHSKAVVFDRETLFIGSLNVNLRSIYLNGETVLIIRSPELAQAVASDIQEAIEPQNSWHVRLDDSGDLVWQANELTFDHEPRAGFWLRTTSRVLSWLPIEKYL